MVHRSSKRTNKVQRWLLVVGIITIGVLDVAFTSYLNGLDTDSVAKTTVPTNAPPASLPVAGNAFEQPAATQDEPSLTAETSDNLSPANEISHHYLKASYSAVRNRMIDHKRSTVSNEQAASSAVPQFDCRLVTYPFIGTGIYVQITDSTNCLTLSSSRTKRDRLIAKTRQSSAKRWQALNTLIAKLK